MRNVVNVLFGFGVIAGGLWGSSVAIARQQPDVVETQVGYVTMNFPGAPGDLGLLPTAVAEAKIAVQHAALAMKSEGNLDAMKLHAGHVMNALDPSVEAKGPGLNYGVKRAAMGVAEHIELAAKGPDASKSIIAHAAAVSASIGSVVKRADEMIAVAQQVRAATTAAEAAPHVAHLNMLAPQLYAGVDANSDGQINWQTGEAGLQQAEVHMQQIRISEGL